MRNAIKEGVRDTAFLLEYNENGLKREWFENVTLTLVCIHEGLNVFRVQRLMIVKSAVLL